MFGSVALDVFIGLVLIYLLYSLLITIIGEMIATWLGLRARILKEAMEKMLNDDTVDPDHLPELLIRTGEFFLYEFDDFKNSFAGRFYEHPSIKYLAQGHKNYLFSFRQGKPAYISQENFTDTLIQMFRNKGIGKDDMEKIKFCLKHNTLQIQPQTLSHLKNLIADANYDLLAFKGKLMQWFNDTMDRTNGWYKRKLQLILFWLGFILAVAFNVDSIKLAQQLSHDKDARNQLVQMAIQASDTTSALAKAIRQTKDTAAANPLLRKSFNDVKKATEDANRILGLGWKYPVGTSGKCWYIFRQCMPWHLRFWGFVITALMLSLGAPFWFDLLKKLVAIRGVGIKPEEREENKKNPVKTPSSLSDVLSGKDRTKTTPAGSDKPEPDLSTTLSDPIDIALHLYKYDLENEPGVISVFKAYFLKGLKKESCIQVNVVDTVSSLKIEKKYRSAKLLQDVHFNIIVSGKPVTHGNAQASQDGNPDKGIANGTELFGWGSFGCMMKDKDDESRKYLVSCYHVMNGDYSWDNKGSNREIKNHTGKISDSYEGFLTYKMDTAYTVSMNDAAYNNYVKYKPRGIREITTDDVLKTPVKFMGYITKNANGIIAHDNRSVYFDYFTGPGQYFTQRIDNLVAVSKTNQCQNSISQGGDSGSLLLDENDNAIGLIVGGDNKYTYAIKLSTIENELGLILDL